MWEQTYPITTHIYTYMSLGAKGLRYKIKNLSVMKLYQTDDFVLDLPYVVKKTRCLMSNLYLLP